MRFPKRKLFTLIISFSKDENDHTLEELAYIINKNVIKSSMVHIIKSKSKIDLLDNISNNVKQYSGEYDILFILFSSNGFIDKNRKYVKFYKEKISDYELCKKMYTNMDIFCTSLCFVDIWNVTSILDFPWQSNIGYVFNLPCRKWYDFYNPNSYCINICNKNVMFIDIIKKYLNDNYIFDFKILFNILKKETDKTSIISRT